jgi:hypothetical protein
VQDSPKGVDVGSSGLNAPADLFGAGIVWGEQPFHGLCRVTGFIEHFGNAEVEELGLAGSVYEDIGRLEIAVNDQLSMRISDAGSPRYDPHLSRGQYKDD